MMKHLLTKVRSKTKKKSRPSTTKSDQVRPCTTMHDQVQVQKLQNTYNTLR